MGSSIIKSASVKKRPNFGSPLPSLPGPIPNHRAFYRLLVGGRGPAPPLGPSHPWPGVDPPGGSTRKAHAAFSSGCVPGLMRMIHGASDSPIGNHRALQRLLPVVDGLGPAPPVGRPGRRFHPQDTCGFLIGGPCLMRMIHGASDSPIPNHRALQLAPQPSQEYAAAGQAEGRGVQGREEGVNRVGKMGV